MFLELVQASKRHIPSTKDTKGCKHFWFFFLFFVRLFFYALAFLFLSFFYSKVPQEQETTPHYHKIVVSKLQICYTNLYRLFDKFRDFKHENLQHESCRSSFFLSLQYMESLFWIKEVEDIDPKYRLLINFWVTNRLTSNTD